MPVVASTCTTRSTGGGGNEDKHRRVVMLARRLPSFRDAVAEDLQDRGLTKRRVVVIRLLRDT